MPLIIPSNSISAGGFAVDNSVRLDGSSSYMTKSMGTPTNIDKYSFSFWVKRSKLGVQQSIFRSTNGGATNDSHVTFQADDTLRFEEYGGSSSIGKLQTTQVFRDISAWYSILLVYDSGNGTAGNRMRMYVNGTEVTTFGTDNNPSQNADSYFNRSGETLSFGRTPYGGGGNYFSGYVVELVMVDGQALTPTDIGEFDEDSGIWKPIDVSGLTFGTNGFYLDFEDSANLGNDANGGTDFTESGLAAIDQSISTPTNIFATWNSLISSKGQTFSEGNTEVSTTVSNKTGGSSTIGMSSGKWFAEFKISAYNNNRTIIGITSNPSELDRTDVDPGSLNYGSGIYFDGRIYVNTSVVTTVGATTLNDIIGVALNLDDNNILYYINGVVQNSGTPISITASSSTDTGNYFFSVGDRSTSSYGTVQANFGSPPYTISSGNTDGNGYGNFEYAVPANYYSLNTKNLSEYG